MSPDLLQEVGISCPYCGEEQSVLAEFSDSVQQYTEDCQVCCRPMVLNVRSGHAGTLTVEARREDDV